MPLYLKNPSFSERICEGKQKALLVEDSFRIAVMEGAFASEDQEILGREVPCEFGRVDLLLKDWVVELKRADLWKEGIGQLMVYGSCFPGRGKWLHLYSENRKKKERLFRGMVEDGCARFGVRLTWDGGEDWKKLY